MARECFFCEKTTTTAGKRKHKYGGKWEYRAKRITRVVKPNLRKIEVEKDGTVMRVDVCMKCYKKIRKAG